MCKILTILRPCATHPRRHLLVLCRNKFGRQARIEAIANSKQGYLAPAEAEGLTSRLKEYYKCPELEEATKWFGRCWQCPVYALEWPTSWSEDVVRRIEDTISRNEDGGLNRGEVRRVEEAVRMAQRGLGLWAGDLHDPLQRGIEYWEVDADERVRSESERASTEAGNGGSVGGG